MRVTISLLHLRINAFVVNVDHLIRDPTLLPRFRLLEIGLGLTTNLWLAAGLAALGLLLALGMGGHKPEALAARANAAK